MSPDPISDEALASVRRVVESPVLRSDPGGVPIVALREVDAAALLARLDAAEAALVPEGVVTLNGKRWRVVRFTSDSGGKDARLVPYRPENTKGAGDE